MKAQPLVVSLLGLACASAHAGARIDTAHPAPNAAADEMASAMAVYERYGLIVAPPPQAVVGRIGFLAGATVDSTVAVIALSFISPTIDVPTIDLTRGGAIVRHITTSGVTRRPADETAVFEQTITLAPGAYELAMGGRSWSLVVPRLAPDSLARSSRPGVSGADALLDYVDRVRAVNERYRGETVPGCETDRGSAYVMLGEPDQVFIESRRFEIWLYTRYLGRLVFADDNGRWRLTPESRETLATLVSRARSRR